MEAQLLTHHPCSIFTHPRPPYRHPTRPKTPYPASRSRRLFSTRYRPWNSNAETARSSQGFNFEDDKDEGEDQDSEFGFGGSRGRKKKKEKRRWWSDESSSSPEMEEGSGGIFEEVFDSFWIFKVFRSYGWTLPPIILSWLLASGPKAVLMALVLPLGQSFTLKRKSDGRTKMKDEKELIEKILQTEINIYRSIRDGTALMQHMEDFYYITLLENVKSNYQTATKLQSDQQDSL